MFYPIVQCIEYTFRTQIFLHIKKHYFIHSFACFSLIDESLQCILKSFEKSCVIFKYFFKFWYITVFCETIFFERVLHFKMPSLVFLSNEPILLQTVIKYCWIKKPSLCSYSRSLQCGNIVPCRPDKLLSLLLLLNNISWF